MDSVHFRAVGVRVSAALGAKTILFVAAWSRVLTFCWQLVALLSSQMSNACSGASSCGRARLRAAKACSAGTLRL